MHLWLIFDCIIIAVFTVCIISARKKGFIRSSGAVVSIILTILLMLVFQDSICAYIKNSSIGDKIKETVVNTLSERKDEADTSEEDESIAERLGLPEFFTKGISEKTGEIENIKQEIIEKTADNITSSVINVLSVVILYFLIKLLLAILLKCLDVIFKLPILNSVNKLLGVIIGAVNALFIIYILCTLLIWFVPKDSTELIKNTIEQTYITKYFYENNLLLKLFM